MAAGTAEEGATLANRKLNVWNLRRRFCALVEADSSAHEGRTGTHQNETRAVPKTNRAPLRAAIGAAALLLPAAAALAQDNAPAARQHMGLMEGLVSTVVYGLVGILLAILGFKLFDLAIKHDIAKEIFEQKNVAAALLAGAVILGVAIIVAATLLS
jgi:uncharacterized membrane protein YjfL (UPF0719 family)